MSARKSISMAARCEAAGKYQLNDEIMSRIWMERLRQRDLLKRKQIKFDCASPIVCHDRKLRVLAEELGEVASAIDRLENLKRDKNAAGYVAALLHLQEELTQNAAVAIAWLEAIQEELK